MLHRCYNVILVLHWCYTGVILLLCYTGATLVLYWFYTAVPHQRRDVFRPTRQPLPAPSPNHMSISGRRPNPALNHCRPLDSARVDPHRRLVATWEDRVYLHWATAVCVISNTPLLNRYSNTGGALLIQTQALYIVPYSLLTQLVCCALQSPVCVFKHKWWNVHYGLHCVYSNKGDNSTSDFSLHSQTQVMYCGPTGPSRCIQTQTPSRWIKILCPFFPLCIQIQVENCDIVFLCTFKHMECNVFYSLSCIFKHKLCIHVHSNTVTILCPTADRTCCQAHLFFCTVFIRRDISHLADSQHWSSGSFTIGSW